MRFALLLLLTINTLAVNGSIHKWSAVQNMTIFMLGDSTMNRQAEKFCTLLNGSMRDKDQLKVCRSKQYNVTLVRSANVVSAGVIDKNAKYVTDAIKATNIPDVVYFNGALHFLHLIPYRKWNYDEWATVEESAIEMVNNVKSMAPRAHVIFMKNHAICEQKYIKGYKEMIQKMKTEPTTKWANECVHWLMKHATESKKSAEEKCVRGIFTTNGVRDLNNRITSSIRNTFDDVAVLDLFMFTLNRCEYTKLGDGRHYSELEYYEVVEFYYKIQELIS